MSLLLTTAPYCPLLLTTVESCSLLLTPTHSNSLLLTTTHYYSLLLTPTHSNSLLLTPTHSNSYPLSGGEGRSRRRRSAKRGAPGGPGEGVRRREMPGCPPVPGEGVRRREMPGCPPVSPFRPQRKKRRSPIRSQISTLLGSSFGSILHRLHCAYVANAFVASQLPRPGLTCI